MDDNIFLPATQSVLLTPKQVADMLGTTVGTLNVWRHYGKYNIPFIRWGKNIRYRKADLDAWLTEHLKNTGPNE